MPGGRPARTRGILGSLGWGRTEEGDRTLVPLYEGCDWEHSFPRIYLVAPRASPRTGIEAEGPGYDPSAAVAGQLEAAARAKKRARLQEDLDDAHREAIEEAQGRLPPETVKAYRNVFGCLPRGWPPGA